MLRSRNLIVLLFGMAVAVHGLRASALAQGEPAVAKELVANCGQGKLDACDRIANPAVVADALTKGCDSGSADGCLGLAIAHFEGSYGFKKDRVIMVGFLERACNGDLSDACNTAATAYRDGEGVPKDLPKAKAYFQKSCDLGNRIGCNSARAVKTKK